MVTGWEKGKTKIGSLVPKASSPQSSLALCPRWAGSAVTTGAQVRGSHLGWRLAPGSRQSPTTSEPCSYRPGQKQGLLGNSPGCQGSSRCSKLEWSVAWSQISPEHLGHATWGRQTSPPMRDTWETWRTEAQHRTVSDLVPTPFRVLRH